jgi:hypothetical protein
MTNNLRDKYDTPLYVGNFNVPKLNKIQNEPATFQLKHTAQLLGLSPEQQKNFQISNLAQSKRGYGALSDGNQIRKPMTLEEQDALINAVR